MTDLSITCAVEMCIIIIIIVIIIISIFLIELEIENIASWGKGTVWRTLLVAEEKPY